MSRSSNALSATLGTTFTRAHRLVAIGGALFLAPPQAVPVAIVDVTVIDVREGLRLEHRTVVLEGTRISEVGAAGVVKVPQGASRIDGRSKYLIPGLWDMHVHLSMAGRGALPALLGHGVTGVRDMGGGGEVVAWRDSIEKGRLVGPRVRAAGTIIESARWVRAVLEMTRPLGRPELVKELEARFALETPADAERAADSLARMGADFAKIRNYPSTAAYFALTGALRRHGLTLVGHSPPLSAVGVVSDSGMRGFEHSFINAVGGRLVEGLSSLPDSSRRALVARLARNGTAWTPTLASGQARLVPDAEIAAMIADSGGRRFPAMRYAPGRLRDEWRNSLEMRNAERDTLTDWAAIERNSAAQVRPMRDAGVRILAGTDLGVVTLVPGVSLHDELELLVQMGRLTAAEALRAATFDAADLLGLKERSGAIAPGFDADLVLLDADPLKDIGATRKVRGVIARGRVFDRSALDRLLGTVR